MADIQSFNVKTLRRATFDINRRDLLNHVNSKLKKVIENVSPSCKFDAANNVRTSAHANFMQIAM